MIRRRRCLSRGPEDGGIVSTLISILFLVLLCATLFLARRPILHYMAVEWIVEDPLDHADAIVILGDDNFYADRATRAAELYRRQMAPVVVASGRMLRPSAGIAELTQHDLIERGVPKDHILPFSHRANNTREEAQALAPLARQRKWHRVIVVTSNYHTRRSRYIFSRVFPPDISVLIASAPDADFDPQDWWTKRVSVKLFARELAGMAVAVWELHGRPAMSKAALDIVSTIAPSALHMVYQSRKHPTFATAHSALHPLKSCTIFTLLSRASIPSRRRATLIV